MTKSSEASLWRPVEDKGLAQIMANAEAPQRNAARDPLPDKRSFPRSRDDSGAVPAGLVAGVVHLMDQPTELARFTQRHLSDNEPEGNPAIWDNATIQVFTALALTDGRNLFKRPIAEKLGFSRGKTKRRIQNLSEGGYIKVDENSRRPMQLTLRFAQELARNPLLKQEILSKTDRPESSAASIQAKNLYFLNKPNQLTKRQMTNLARKQRLYAEILRRGGAILTDDQRLEVTLGQFLQAEADMSADIKRRTSRK